jgi:uncharacterized protein YfbU (UPF0304 family)
VAKIKLTEAERLILANQYEILSKLDDGDESLARLAANLRDGHEWIYEDKLQLSPVLDEGSVQHVLTILGIYSPLRQSYEELSDKSGINEHALTFPGFDGNNEGELLHFSRALAANGNYSETIGEQARNSHHPTTDLYNRMIAKWRELGEPTYPYSKEQILGILGARIHPSNRK